MSEEFHLLSSIDWFGMLSVGQSNGTLTKMKGKILICPKCEEPFFVQTTYEHKACQCPYCNYLAYIPEEAYQ